MGGHLRAPAGRGRGGRRLLLLQPRMPRRAASWLGVVGERPDPGVVSGGFVWVASAAKSASLLTVARLPEAVLVAAVRARGQALLLGMVPRLLSGSRPRPCPLARSAHPGYPNIIARTPLHVLDIIRHDGADAGPFLGNPPSAPRASALGTLCTTRVVPLPCRSCCIRCSRLPPLRPTIPPCKPHRTIVPSGGAPVCCIGTSGATPVEGLVAPLGPLGPRSLIPFFASHAAHAYSSSASKVRLKRLRMVL